jgi:hypothetical protein
VLLGRDDMPDEMVEYMDAAWPKALAILKAICEAK